MKRLLNSLILAIVFLSLTSGIAYGFLYRAQVSVTENASTDYAQLPVMWNSPNTWLANNGFMNASGNDTRVQSLGGLEYPWMLSDNRTLTALAVEADSQTNLYFSTGESEASAMDIILGYGGSANITDVPALELGDNGTIEFETYLGAASTVFVAKENAFYIQDNGSGNVSGGIGSSGWVSPNSFTDASSIWSSEASAYDGDTGTKSNSGNGATTIAATSWGAFCEFILPATVDITKIRIWSWGEGAPAAGITLTDVDVWDGAWNDVSSAAPIAAWTEYAAVYSDVTKLRVRFYNTAAGARVGYLYEVQVYTEDILMTNEVSSAYTEGKQKVTMTLDGVDMKLYLDDVEKDSIAVVAVTDNGNDWVIKPDPYFTYYSHSVGGVEKARYEPASMIIGTTLIDEVGSNDAVITWGSNPAGVGATLGSMTSSGQIGAGVDIVSRATGDILATSDSGSSDMFGDGTVTKAETLANPFRSAVTAISDNTTLSEILTWRIFGSAVLLLVVAGILRLLRGHIGIAAFIGTGVYVFLTSFDGDIFPMWMLLPLVGVSFLLVLVSERSQSI